MTSQNKQPTARHGKPFKSSGITRQGIRKKKEHSDNVDNKQHKIPEEDAAIELDSTSYEDWLANLNLPSEKTFQLEVHVEDISYDENDGGGEYFMY